MERCRFCNCMKSREFCENIFDNKQTNPTIPTIVELFTNLKIVEDDPYTKFICFDCFNILIVFYHYRERVLETNQLLRNEIENKQNKVEDFHKKWPRIEQNDGQFVVYNHNFDNDCNTNLRIGDDDKKSFSNNDNNDAKDNQELDKNNLCTEKSVSFIKNEIDMEGICVKIENDIDDDEEQNIYENNHHLNLTFGNYNDNKPIINDNQISDNNDADRYCSDIINDELRIEECSSAIGNIGKSAKMSDTAKRCKNYSEVEKKQLLEIIKRYEYIIENKKINSATIKRKKEAWETIAKEFNSTTINTRSSQQLKSLYKNLKCRGKKDQTQEHMETNKTNDGTFKKSLSSTQELLMVSVDKNTTPLHCSYDRDCHYFVDMQQQLWPSTSSVDLSLSHQQEQQQATTNKKEHQQEQTRKRRENSQLQEQQGERRRQRRPLVSKKIKNTKKNREILRFKILKLQYRSAKLDHKIKLCQLKDIFKSKEEND